MAKIKGGKRIAGAALGVGDGFPESGAQAGGVFKVAKGHYDFAAQAGAQGDFSLMPDTIPSGAVVMGGFVYVTTAPTSAAMTAEIALKVEGAGDLVAAIAVSNAQWTGAGSFHAIVPVLTAATFIKTTAARGITMTLTVQNLTAGKFDVYLFYVDSL